MLYTQRERCEVLGEYLAENGETVRSTASHFRISKSTVHKDITVRLRLVNPELCDRVEKVLEKNKAERHLRGGEATKRKYLHIGEDTV